MGLDRPDRILAVLQEVVGDQEVDRGVGKFVEPLAVVDDVHRRQRQLGQLRVVGSEVLDRHPVDVGDAGPRRNWHRLVQSADLDTPAAQELGRQLPARVSADDRRLRRPLGRGDRRRRAHGTAG